MGGENITNHTELPDNNESFKKELSIAELLESLNELISDTAALDSFRSLISRLSKEGRQSILNTLTTGSTDSLVTYLQNNGVPTHEMALKFFGKNFWIDPSLIKIENKKEVTNKNIDTANIASLTDIYEAMSYASNNSKAFQLLEQVAQWWTNSEAAYQELKDLLLSNPEELNALVSLIQRHDTEHQTNYYATFKSTLISADPVFLEILDELAGASYQETDEYDISRAYISSLTGDQVQMQGNIIHSINSHWDKINVDTSSQPPERTIALTESEYTLGTDIQLGELHKPDTQYRENLHQLGNQLKSLNLLQSKFVQDHIQDLTKQWATLIHIKHQFESIYKIDLDFITNLDELTDLPTLQNQERQTEQEIQSIKHEYQTAINKAIRSQREKVKEQDEKTREVLQFIKSIGFDLIPQKYTDQLIQEVQSGYIVLSDMNIDPAKIDLSNGTFWEPETERDGTSWKKNLIEFFNKFVSGNIDEPLNVESHLGLLGKTENRAELMHKLYKQGVLTKSGAFDIELARSNLGATTK